MNKSLFTKYFVTCSAVVLISLALMGAIMMLVASQYFGTEKHDLLKGNTTDAVELTVENCEYQVNATTGEKEIMINSLAIQRYYGILAKAIDAQLVLVDGAGKAEIIVNSVSETSHGEVGNFSVYSVPQKILDKMQTQEYFEVSTLGGIYSSQHYIYGLPVRMEDGGLVGYLFAAAPATAMTEFLLQILQMFSVSAIFVIFLSFMVFYFITLQLVRPLRRMGAAARRFGSGDFTERIEVRGEDEIAELAQSLNNMAQSLSVLETTRRSFVANVSHELRTPMTTIAGFVDGVLDGTIPKEKEREYLTIVSDEVKRLSRLVRAMLNMSRIETGEVQIKKVDFDLLDVILQTLFSFEREIEAKQVTIGGLDHDKVIVEADKDLIHQVVYNLVENAVKFVDEGGTISFAFHAEGGRTYVRIRNTGAGLSKEEVQHVFERFYKSDKSRGLDKNGVGLGLYIVHTIVGLHDGEIIVRSVEGEYTEFEFYIPTGKLSKALKSKTMEF